LITPIRAFDFEYGQVDWVSPRIRRIVAENAGPFTYTGTGTYLVGGSAPGAEVAVIDPGPLDDRHLTALVEATAGQRVAAVLVTHTHLDHAPLARPFAAAVGATIYAARPPSIGTPAESQTESPIDFAPDVVVSDGDPIAGDDWTLRTVATPGHASNHLAFWLDEERALFSGDHVMGWSTTVVAPPDGDMLDYMHSLQKVIELDPAVIWPTHGPPVREPRPFLADYLAHRTMREAQILERLGAGDRRVRDMVARLYAEVDPRLWPAASLSVWAHLIALEKQGRVKSSPSSTIDAEWSPT